MKRAMLLLVSLLIATAVLAGEMDTVNMEEISLKAGPTEPGEEVALVWLEAFVYPKTVAEKGTIHLGVRTTAKMKAVTAGFDFTGKTLALISTDGMTWSGSYVLPSRVHDGLHMVRYTLYGSKGTLRRTLDFVVEDAQKLAQKQAVQKSPILGNDGWPLTVVSSCTAISKQGARALKSGESIKGISKDPWYEVVFEDGQVGWVPARLVKEPFEEYYRLGYVYYEKEQYDLAIEQYKKAVTINPTYVKAHFWLAKSYYKQDDLEASYNAIKAAIRLDERDINNKLFASLLAQRYSLLAHTKYLNGRYHEAIMDYQVVLDLKPTSINAWLEIGKCYGKLGFVLEARSAWQAALKIDPQNLEAHRLLGIEANRLEAGSIDTVAQGVKKLVSPAPGVKAALADDAMKILRAGKTKKGTSIENALTAVITLTKSLGTPVVEKGWLTKKQGDKLLVAYVCEQGNGGEEVFEWTVDVDAKNITPYNDNARLLMNRW